MSKENKNAKTNLTYEAARRIRRDWNGVNPVTKIIPDKTKYTRKRNIKILTFHKIYYIIYIYKMS